MPSVAASDFNIPASGAWREGRDAPGQRKFLRLPSPFPLERGGLLPEVTVAYETYGQLNAAGDNAVLVEHALTGDSHVAGAAGPGHPTKGWWTELVGPGRVLDTQKYFIVATNVLGGCQGTTGPSSISQDGKPWGSRFPRITVLDQVNAEVAVADGLGIRSWACVIGGSMGGMRALQWASTYPDRVRSIAVLASSYYATAAQIGTQSAQIEVIRNDPNFRGGDYYEAADGSGPYVGLGLARKIAFLTYRSELELEERFGRNLQHGEQELLEVQSYFSYQAEKLARRFDANSYIVLTDAMNSWNLKGLGDIEIPAVIAGVDSDALYPLRLQQELAEGLPHCIGGLRVMKSRYGHDGFLLETEQIAQHLQDALGCGRLVSAKRGGS